MAGVLFIIWIPCEGYEQLLTNIPVDDLIWETSKEPQQKVSSSDEEEINNENAENAENAKVRKVA